MLNRLPIVWQIAYVPNNIGISAEKRGSKTCSGAA